MYQVSRDRYKWYAILAILVGISSPIGCSRTITTGGFETLEIGMTKEQVAAKLVKQGVYGVVPYLNQNIVVLGVSDIEDLYDKKSVPGICVNDNSGFSIQIGFDLVDRAGAKYISIPAREFTEEIVSLSTRQDVLLFIGRLMAHNSNLVAANCILDEKEILLTGSDSVIEGLNRYDSWFYSIPSSYSNAVLRFSSGVLVKIEYRWRPFEVP